MSQAKPKIYNDELQTRHEIALFRILAVKIENQVVKDWGEYNIFNSLYQKLGKEKAETFLQEIRDFPHLWQTL